MDLIRPLRDEKQLREFFTGPLCLPSGSCPGFLERCATNFSCSRPWQIFRSAQCLQTQPSYVTPKLGKFLWKVFRPIFIIILGNLFGDLGGFEGNWGNIGVNLENKLGKVPERQDFTLKKRYFTLKNIIAH